MPFGSFFFKPKKKTGEIKEWIELQSFSEDAIIYLIEKEIYENGIRDLGYVIPRLRNKEYFDAQLKPVALIPESSGFEYSPGLNSLKLNQRSNEPKSTDLVEKIISKQSELYSTTFKASSSPVVVGPSNATDLSNIDTACYDD